MDPDLLARLRREYGEAGLTEAAAGDEPYPLLDRWFADAVAAGITEPNAMALATVGPDGRPSVRVVLCKALDERGPVFYTGYGSRKSRDLAVEPWCAVALLWHDIGRQVRIEGPAERVSAAESDAYFSTRPRSSRLGAWASPQSSVVPDRDDLERRLAETERRFAAPGGGLDVGPGGQPETAVPRPDGWGGWRVALRTVEFWQGRRSRMHDRLRFTREGHGWVRERLGP
ncbi:MAG TPA: pyridoxamine 5'-phosphate oxidase [Nocardioidaceae bacterium]|nr:pyridoxamine 5'-phosphate oxidase [Nocardioidaceae bacterium]